ncbi:hypothetical protein VP01_7006g1 [Puccinia sorghi]|uniref:Uncharacterized protein n=1 Tax=Puccinia sorghi TaxID=27349 RepID=A0A0L6UFZ2_9BASI|nr:hypothetical protein VP01_7006g1 [Puccinia sorghi]
MTTKVICKSLWVLPMKANVYKTKSLSIVTGAVSCPDPKKDKDNSRLFAKMNEDAYVKIIQHISQNVLALVSSMLPPSNKFDGYSLWQLLKSKYAGNDLTSQTTALKLFLSLKFNNFKTFLSSVRSTQQDCWSSIQ